jgi:small subunit ribosomal protein S9
MTTKKDQSTFSATGKRKTSIARVIMTPGDGEITVNKRPFEQYFGRAALQMIVHQPFDVTGTVEKFNIRANINGGGIASQADALKYGIAKALLSMNADYRKPLKKAGFLTRDAREVERKKYGRHKARRSHQFSKR